MSTEPTTALAPVAAPPAGAPPPPATRVPPAPGIVFDGHFRIPAGICDLDSFRCWARSEEHEEYEQPVRLAWLAGTLWVDLTMEQLYTHNQVKTEVTVVLGPLVKTSGRGRYLTDGMLLSNTAGDWSTIPDGLFFTYEALTSGRIHQVAGKVAGVVELEGTPEMVLEVVSDSSVEKDTVYLPKLYARAGIPEFWRIDARGAKLSFEILRLTEAGYVPAQEPDDWWHSAVFGRSFRLTHQTDPQGQPEFTLLVRERQSAESPSGG
jgi:Uma2 family endonuclease